MKKCLVISFLCASAVVALGDWLYSGSTLTECDSTGTPLAEGAWVFSATAAKTLTEAGEKRLTVTCSTVGTNPTVDFASKIHVPEGGTPGVIVTIPKGCFSAASSSALPTTVKLPDTLTTIGESAFSFAHITTIEPFLPDSVASIAQKAFMGCGVTGALRIGHGGNALTNPYLFSGTKITSVDIGEGVTAIGKYVFSGCSSLTSVKLPDTLVSIGGEVFKGCTALETIEPFFPSSVTTVGYRAFWESTAITSPLTIGGNKESSYSYDQIFYRASNPGIPSITIGEGITSLSGSYFLSYISGATEIKFLCDRPTIASGAFNRNAKTAPLTCRVYLPASLPGWSEFLKDAVVPWSDVSEEDKAVYFENFGEDANIPDGILQEVDSSMGGLRNQWYFNTSISAGLTIFVR